MSDPSNLEHLDEVVSAYVDGEATPEEVRLVEADPALVEQARQLRELVAMDQIEVVPDPDMKRRHLSNAMAAFEAPSVGQPDQNAGRDMRGAGQPAPVVTADDAAAAPVVDLASRRRGPAGLPRWLSAAAGLVIVVGGIGFVASQNSSEDSAAVETSGDSADEAFASRPDDEAMEDEAMEDDEDAMEDEVDSDASVDAEAAADTVESDEDAMEEESADAAMEDEEDAMEDDEAAMEDDAGADASADDSGLSRAAEVPADITTDELLTIAEEIEVLPIEAALCASAFTTPTAEIEALVGPLGGTDQTIEFFPLLVGGEPSEFVVVTDADGERRGVLFDSNCSIVEP